MPRVSVEKRQQCEAIWHGMRALNDKVKAEGRAMTAEEEQQWATMDADLERTRKERDADEAAFAAQEEAEQKRDAKLEEINREMRSSVLPRPQERESLHNRHEGEHVVSDFARKLIRGQSFDHSFKCRQVTVGKQSEGGFTLQPDAFVAELLRDVDNEVHIRRLARKLRCARGQSLFAPTVATRMGAPAWVGELASGSADSTLAFGKRTLTPHALALKVYVSKTLLDGGSPIDAEATVREESAYALAITQENAYLNGSGSRQPLGVFVSSANGISSSRDITTAGSGVMVADDVLSLVGSLKDNYLRSAVFIMHRDMKTRVRKFKAGDGHYLWSPGVMAGGSLSQPGPETIEGRPLLTSEYAPNTYTSTNYTMILGDFSRYWVVDSLDMTIQRLVELRADYNEDQFNLRYEGDGAPAREEAFARLKLQ